MVTAILILTVVLPLGQIPIPAAPANEPVPAIMDSPPAGQWGPPARRWNQPPSLPATDPRFQSDAPVLPGRLLSQQAPAGSPASGTGGIAVAASVPVAAGGMVPDTFAPVLPLRDKGPIPTATMPPAAPSQYLPPPRAAWADERQSSGLGWAIVSTPDPSSPMSVAAPDAGLKRTSAAAAVPAASEPILPAVLPPVMEPPSTTGAAKAPAPDRPIATTETKVEAAGPPAVAGSVVNLETIGPATITQGKPITYEIVARNQGTVPAINVRVEEELPAGARFLGAEPPATDGGLGENTRKLSWVLPRLETGAEKRFKVTIHPMGSATEFQSKATATFSVASSLRTHVTQPRLTLTQTGPASVPIGQMAAFRVVVANPGTGAATHVVLRERLPAALKHPQGNDIEADLGTLAAGATRTITLSTTAARGGKHVVEGTVTADDGLQAEAQATITVAEAALFLHLTGPGHRLINREAEFELEVINAGTAPAGGVVVVNAVPEGFDFVSANQGGKFETLSRTAKWTIGTLEPGQKKSLGLKLMARTAGDLVNRGLARADGGLEAKADASVRCEGIPALMLEVVDLEDPVEVGSETTYEIRVVNQGTAPSTGIRISATLPDGMGLREASGPVPYHVQQQQIVFDAVQRLAAHADCLYRIRVVGKAPGDWRFKTQLTCDQLRLPVNKEESTRVYKE